MRMAGRLSRRVRACCKAHGIPLQDCLAGEKKWKIAQEHLSPQEVRTGLFLVLVSRAASATTLRAVADTLGTESAIGLLRQVCERWIYTARFAVDGRWSR